MMLAKVSGELDALINMHSDDLKEIKRQANSVSMSFIERAIFEILHIIDLSKGASYPRILIEAGLIKVSNCLSQDEEVEKVTRESLNTPKSNCMKKQIVGEIPVAPVKPVISKATAVTDEPAVSKVTVTTDKPAVSEMTVTPAEVEVQANEPKEGIVQGEKEENHVAVNNEFVFESDELSGLSISLDKLTGKKEEKKQTRDVKEVMKEIYNIDVVEEE